MLTSFGAYESDIAVPLELSAGRDAELLNSPLAATDPLGHPARGSRRVLSMTKAAEGRLTRLERARLWWERANLNSWGYGRNVLNGGIAPSMHRCMERCICPDGGADCTAPSCMLTVVEG